MAYLRQPPPSMEFILETFADWMAQHGQVMVTVRIDYKNGTYFNTKIDHRVPKVKGELNEM